jgi:hypothetical protein
MAVNRKNGTNGVAQRPESNARFVGDSAEDSTLDRQYRAIQVREDMRTRVKGIVTTLRKEYPGHGGSLAEILDGQSQDIRREAEIIKRRTRQAER